MKRWTSLNSTLHLNIICVYEGTDTSPMANQALSYIDQAYKEALDNDEQSQKNLHAFIGHIYPPPCIQVMEAFAEYKPLDQEFAKYQPLDQ
mgnify:CR=1 FL=1